jgi:UDP:flavonoid glycosyltransferase YjiC (YdhE family)
MTDWLVYATPGRGHIYPATAALLELRDRGHDIAIRCGAAEARELAALGFDAAPVSPAVEAVDTEDWKARTPIGAQRLEVRAFARRAAAEQPDLRAAIEDLRPRALLVDALGWGAMATADASGLPWALLGHFALPIASRDAPPYGLGLGAARGPLGRVRDTLARHLLLRPLERVALPAVNGARAAEGLPPLRSADELFGRTAPLVLQFTAEPFEYPRSDWPPAVRLVGPGTFDPPAEEPDWLAAEQRPVVLVTCSTDFQDDGRLIAATIEALAGEELFVVATTAAVDPATIEPAANARVERFLPHGPIIRRAACVVCHGGQGITQKALAAGVPVVAVPFGRDQYEVARRVEVAAAGVRLPAPKLRADRLRAAVRQAIGMREGAKRVADGFAAVGGAAAAADALEALAGPATPRAGAPGTARSAPRSL